MNFFRVQVQIAHLGSKQTEHVEWHIATSASAGEVFANAGHLLAGIRNVTEVHAITEDEWEAARRWGQKAFRVEPR